MSMPSASAVTLPTRAPRTPARYCCECTCAERICTGAGAVTGWLDCGSDNNTRGAEKLTSDVVRAPATSHVTSTESAWALDFAPKLLQACAGIGCAPSGGDGLRSLL